MTDDFPFGDLRARVCAADRAFSWHPYTPMRAYLDEHRPLVIGAARGARLYDLDGRSYLDGNGSWWVAVLGHGHPRLVAALQQQAARLCHVSFAGITHEPGALLAEELVAVAPPGLARVFYSDDGSTAVEVALKLALQFWHNQGATRRHRFVALDDAFHGDTLGACSLGGIEVFRRPFAGALCDCVHVPTPPQPGAEDEAYGRAFEALATLVRRDRDELCAVVVEPLLQGAAGMRSYAPRYLRELRALCDRHEVLLVADEVFTGYGRTGAMWACEAAGVSPDLLCTAKGFTGGVLPMAATLASSAVFDAFLGAPERAFFHGHSFTGNPLGAAVAREVLAVFREEAVLERARPKAARLAEAFARMASLPGVRSHRACGMTAALDLAGVGGYLGRAGWRVYAEALARGAYLRPLGDTVYVAPPLVIDDADLEELLGIVEESVRAAVAAG
ncbi:MAG: adenosylmethionine--8-amino-7-oxononanoate transaminase [Myxococcales bacterium]|nr:adenosylmethionine--8-amino-7-oxononanoate transaminase [Myxococcales bacterium]